MLWEDNYLAHYGIKLQKWGIRRFQNLDGSLTPEGRKRYALPKDKKGIKRVFKSAEKDLKKNLSNEIPELIEKPLDVDAVRRRGELSESEAEECSSIAEKMYKKASVVEPEITEDVVSAIEDSGGTMYGLNNRLKQPSSIAAKIGADAKRKGIEFDEAADSIKDTIRYTSVSDDSHFTSNYYLTKSSLEDKGYTEVRCKNYFDFYRQGTAKHKSVQCVYENQNGDVFELQYQTPASQTAKDLKVPLYEERRAKGTSSRRKAEIEQQMVDLAECVPTPKNVFDIRSYG